MLIKGFYEVLKLKSIIFLNHQDMKSIVCGIEDLDLMQLK